MKALSFFVAFLFALYILPPMVICQDKVEKIKEKVEYKSEHKEYKYKERAFCSGDNWSNGDKVSYREAREFTVASSGSLNVDGGRNGGVKVLGGNRSDVLVKACVQTWGINEEAAKGIASRVRIDTGSTIKADNPEEGWSVSYEIYVPRNTNLDLRAHNGGISIKSVDGNIGFETTNGGVSLADLSGSVKGRTTNGGVNVSLTGASWKGSGLDVVTTNGGVNLTVPDGYAASFETGTTNGGFKSDVAGLNVEQEDNVGKNDHWQQRSKRVRASMNGGGAPIRVTTTNGGVRIGSSVNE